MLLSRSLVRSLAHLQLQDNIVVIVLVQASERARDQPSEMSPVESRASNKIRVIYANWQRAYRRRNWRSPSLFQCAAAATVSNSNSLFGQFQMLNQEPGERATGDSSQVAAAAAACPIEAGECEINVFVSSSS